MSSDRQYQVKDPQTATSLGAQMLPIRPFAPQVANDLEAAPQALDQQQQTQDRLDKTFTFGGISVSGSGGAPTIRRNLLQAKLTIGQPNDPYEQEADRVAAKVVQRTSLLKSRPPKPILQRQDLKDDADELQMKPQVSRLQRQEIEEEELQMKPLQRQKSQGNEKASVDLETSINSAKGSGQSLDPGVQQQMGQAIGADFSGVKVHSDATADRLSQSIQAKAFTTGKDIFFKSGEYNPNSRSGQELLAHELTHVVQQTGRGDALVQREIDKQAAIEDLRTIKGGVFTRTSVTNAKRGQRALQLAYLHPDSLLYINRAYKEVTKTDDDTVFNTLLMGDLVQKLGVLGGNAAAVPQLIQTFASTHDVKPLVYGAYKQAYGETAFTNMVLELKDVEQPPKTQRGSDSAKTELLKKEYVLAYFKRSLQTGGDGADFYRQLNDGYMHGDPFYRAQISEAYAELFGDVKMTNMLVGAGERYARSTQKDVDLTSEHFAASFDGKNADTGAGVYQQLCLDHPDYSQTITKVCRAKLGNAEFVKMLYQIGDLGQALKGSDDGMLLDLFTQMLTAKSDAMERKILHGELIQKYPLLKDLVNSAYRSLTSEDTMVDELAGKKIELTGSDSSETETAAKDQEAKRAFLKQGLLTTGGAFHPKTGIGRFEASYDPQIGQLQILSKIYFNFVNHNETGTAWTDPERADFEARMIDETTRIWSRQHTLQCVKPGWENIVAIPTMKIEVVDDPANAHFQIDALKAVEKSNDPNASTQPAMGKELRSNNNKSSVDIDQKKVKAGVATLQQYDVKDKFRDPVLHQYLHQGQVQSVVKNAFLYDRDRLVKALASIGTVAYNTRSIDRGPNLDAQADQTAQALESLAIPGALAHLHPVVIQGAATSSERDRLAINRATHFKACLEQRGITAQPLQTEGNQSGFAGVSLEAAPLSSEVKDTYINNWSRISAAHEFGHMIGLIDEYIDIESATLAKLLIKDKTHPPGTSVDHLGNAPESGSVALKQKAFAELLEASGTKAPNFEHKTGKPKGASMLQNTSIMTGGYEVLAGHYVTMWEVLTHMTKGHLQERDWKIH
jgi:Domain of unknown function (DUF4157)